MKKKYGIANLKIALLAVCQLTLLVQSIFKNGKKGWIGYILKICRIVVKDWKKYKNFDYSQIISEIKDLDQSEVKDLVYFITVNLNVTGKTATSIINKALKMS